MRSFQVFSGFTYPLQALLSFWRNPRLLLFLLIPLLLNLILGFTVYRFILSWGWNWLQQWQDQLNQWIQNFTIHLPLWLQGIRSILTAIDALFDGLVIIVLFAVIGLLFLQFGVILGAPWYGKLSEKLEENRRGSVEIIEVGIVRDIGRAVLFEVKKLALVISLGVPLLLINFIPVVGNVVSTIGSVLLTGTIICLDFFDATLERRRLSFRHKIKLIYQSLPATASFSLTCFFLISLPLLNIITIPICVSGGTLFVCDYILPKLNPSSPEAKTQLKEF